MCTWCLILHGIDTGLDAGKGFGRHFDHSILGQEKTVRAVGIGGVRLTWSQLEHVSVWYVEVTSGPIFGRARVYVLFFLIIFSCENSLLENNKLVLNSIYKEAKLKCPLWKLDFDLVKFLNFLAMVFENNFLFSKKKLPLAFIGFESCSAYVSLGDHVIVIIGSNRGRVTFESNLNFVCRCKH